MKRINKDFISVREAAEIMGVTKEYVTRLIRQNCPKCGGAGCRRCYQTGRRLPAQKIGDSTLSQWAVIRQGLEIPDIVHRKVGPPFRKKITRRS